MRGWKPKGLKMDSVVHRVCNCLQKEVDLSYVHPGCSAGSEQGSGDASVHRLKPILFF